MNKPEWADEWSEETFDYGHERAFMAEVEGVRNAVRFLGQKCIKEPVYGPEYEVTREVWCDECETSHEETFMTKSLITPGVYEPVPLVEKEIHTILEDWFKMHAKKCVRYINAAKERGWL
jgi:hypothetical protein